MAVGVHGYVRTLKAFFAWLAREEYIKDNPMAKIPVPKAEAKLVATFSEDQIQGLLGLCLASNGSRMLLRKVIEGFVRFFSSYLDPASRIGLSTRY
jgi:site-specific recombinase XerD